MGKKAGSIVQVSRHLEPPDRRPLNSLRRKTRIFETVSGRLIRGMIRGCSSAGLGRVPSRPFVVAHPRSDLVTKSVPSRFSRARRKEPLQVRGQRDRSLAGKLLADVGRRAPWIGAMVPIGGRADRKSVV